MTNEQLDNIKAAFPDGIRYMEYCAEGEERVRIYMSTGNRKRGSFFGTWQIDVPAEQPNTGRLKAICDAVNYCVDAHNGVSAIIRKVNAAEAVEGTG